MKSSRSPGLLPKIWDALRESSPAKRGRRRFGDISSSLWNEFEIDGIIDYANLPPLDGEEGELIDDEACFIDVRAVTGVGGSMSGQSHVSECSSVRAQISSLSFQTNYLCIFFLSSIYRQLSHAWACPEPGGALRPITPSGEASFMPAGLRDGLLIFDGTTFKHQHR